MKVLIELTVQEYVKVCAIADDLRKGGYDSLQQRIKDGTIIEEEEEKMNENI